ncbi:MULTISPECIES: hypothetical protein [Protofrankia]|uniref:Uncharacterized protein n=1 Tax=Candidatus Protofrankia datiscae TaxID=2716812 RepID=F8AW27_9ACTN|nr:MULTISPECIES: hypothetical protein [Protofrankia]AEH11349.1 hypothetical protein FsymDg_4078 [Candidatus Protofrankia datiscae]
MATIRTSADKSGDTVEASADVKIPLSEVRKPLYAYVGAADAAVEKIRSIPTVYADEIKKFSSRVNGLSVHAQRLPANVQTAVTSLPTSVSSQLSDLQGRASSLYSNFADRGEKRVARIRQNPTTEEAVTRTRNVVSRARAVRSSATTKSADSAEKKSGTAQSD